MSIHTLYTHTTAISCLEIRSLSRVDPAILVCITLWTVTEISYADRGSIGSHTIIELLNEGYEVVAIDNLRNSSYEAIRRIEQITGKKVTFYKVDLLDKKALQQVFQRQSIWAVIHFAGLKAVGESTKIPLDYFHDNITGSILLMKAMKEAGVKNIVFSSSATVYGEPKVVPIPETSPTVRYFIADDTP